MRQGYPGRYKGFYGECGGIGQRKLPSRKQYYRTEVTVIVNRMLERSADKEFIDGTSLKEFSDVAKTHWAYNDIMETANACEYTKGSSKESWGSLKQFSNHRHTPYPQKQRHPAGSCRRVALLRLSLSLSEQSEIPADAAGAPRLTNQHDGGGHGHDR
jgi:hypothetical protein